MIDPTLDWRKVFEESTVVDTHIHPSLEQQLFHRNLNYRYAFQRVFSFLPLAGEFDVRSSFPRMWRGGYDVALSALLVPERRMTHDFPIINALRIIRPDLWHNLIAAPPAQAGFRILDELEDAVEQFTAKAPMKMARSVAELDAILSQPKGIRPDGPRPVVVIHAMEGAHHFHNESNFNPNHPDEVGVMKNLTAFFDRGVACLTLAHFYFNGIAHPCYPYPEDVARISAHPDLWSDPTLGLTSLGKRVVERMIEMGMLIDLTHSSPRVRHDVYDIVDNNPVHGQRVPLFATHVGVYAINPSPYNVTDWEIRRIARDGGMVGVIFMPYWLMPKESGQGINFLSRTIQHLVDVGGDDVAGIGTDFDGFTTPPDDLDNPERMGRLAQRLVLDGHPEWRIKKIMGGNALRVLRTGWRK